jgi:hypothetical protein
VNIFTTEHPLASQPSWFDTKAFPVLSFVCSVVVLALMLAPLVFVRLCYYVFSDIGAEADPFPDPCLAILLGSVLAFAFSLVCAFPVVLAYRLLARKGRRRYTA